MIVWITGRPASGKTTLARRVVDACGGVLVDSDEVRRAITPHPTYTADERALVYRSLAYLARRMHDAGLRPIVAATAHDPALRAAAREICGELFLVLADCPLDVCEARDPKGLYRAARRGSGTMPGVHVPWVDPTEAELVVPTDRAVPDEVIAAIATAARRAATSPRAGAPR